MHDYKINQAWLDAAMIACVLLAWLKLPARQRLRELLLAEHGRDYDVTAGWDR